jgi:hypothetical protein
MKFLNEKAIKGGALILGVFLGGEAVVDGKHYLAIMPSQDHVHHEPYQAPKISKPLTITMSTSADLNVVSIQQWLDDAGK